MLAIDALPNQDPLQPTTGRLTDFSYTKCIFFMMHISSNETGFF